MTQAIAVSEILRRRGHTVEAVLAGGDLNRSLPSFFESAFDVAVQRIASPSFALKHNRRISLFDSGAAIFRNLPAFRKSLATIDAAIEEHKPDLILNFFEPLLGFYNLLRRPKTPTLVIGHQFMMSHPRFFRVREFPMQRLGMNAYLRITGARSSKLALSFYPEIDAPAKRITVCPPILRRQLFELTPVAGTRLLVYLAFHGFSKDIVEWHRAHPEIPIDCFYDKPGAPEEDHVTASLVFHRLDGEKFLKLMARCRAVVCTAGVESVSEAAYLGKPLMMVPVENHLEQFVNAKDAEQRGLGIADERFALSRVVDPGLKPAGVEFRDWIHEAGTILLRAVEEAACSPQVERGGSKDRLLPRPVAN